MTRIRGWLVVALALGGAAGSCSDGTGPVAGVLTVSLATPNPGADGAILFRISGPQPHLRCHARSPHSETLNRESASSRHYSWNQWDPPQSLLPPHCLEFFMRAPRTSNGSPHGALCGWVRPRRA